MKLVAFEKYWGAYFSCQVEIIIFILLKSTVWKSEIVGKEECLASVPNYMKTTNQVFNLWYEWYFHLGH